MTLDEVFDEEPVISKGQARHEIARHGLLWTDFTSELGDCESYNGWTVLEWLGY